eukprot:UN15880
MLVLKYASYFPRHPEVLHESKTVQPQINQMKSVRTEGTVKRIFPPFHCVVS